MRPWALLLGEPFVWNSWGNLFEAVHTGKPGFNHAHGQDFFDYLHGHPAAAAIFNAAMSGSSAHECAAILDAYDFHGLAKIVDVGGGQGTLLKSILTRHPDARGTLCDLPSVIVTAHSMRDPEIASRCDVVGIDFFQNVPAGGDAYILKKIVHDWNDAEVICLLRNCRNAISVDGKLIVIESIIKAPNQPDPAKWKDLNMLALVAGRERTLEEFGSLFFTAGFKVDRVFEAGNLSIITGIPV